jgi:HSP20 family protein
MFNLRFAPHLIRFDNANRVRPDVDIIETADNYLFKFEIPGMHKNDIKIWLENNTLTVSGEKKIPDNSDRLLAERSFGNFARTFKLPAPVDKDKVSAELVDGVLAITLSKAKVAAEISIN